MLSTSALRAAATFASSTSILCPCHTAIITSAIHGSATASTIIAVATTLRFLGGGSGRHAIRYGLTLVRRAGGALVGSADHAGRFTSSRFGATSRWLSAMIEPTSFQSGLGWSSRTPIHPRGPTYGGTKKRFGSDSTMSP